MSTLYALNLHADQPDQGLRVGATSSLKAPCVLEMNPSRAAAGCSIQVYRHFGFSHFFSPYTQSVNMWFDKCSR